MNNKELLDTAGGSKKHLKCKNLTPIKLELLESMDTTISSIKEKQCKDAIPYIMWNNFVNKNGTLADKSEPEYHRYVWGDKVFVDFGMTNIKTEISYPHPAIVLYNFPNTIIVVPTTSDDKIEPFKDEIEECIIKVKGDGKIFKNDSIINLHQIKAIHKERIINNLRCNVKNFHLSDGEIIRLNSLENYKFFRNGDNLLDCINMKLNLMTNKEFLNNHYMESAYDYNKIYELNKKICELESLLEEDENIKKVI